MKKLIQRGIIILIGLSLMSCDPEESFYVHIYDVFFENKTTKELELVFHTASQDFNSTNDSVIKLVDTFTIVARGRSPFKYFSSPYHDFEKNDSLAIVRNTVTELLYQINSIPTSKFEVYVENRLSVEWNPPAGSYGAEDNSPYNYDSWKVVEYENIKSPRAGEFVYGEIIFTITDKDLE